MEKNNIKYTFFAHMVPEASWLPQKRTFGYGRPQKNRKKTSSENTVPPLRQFSFLKPIIPLRAVPKKSKKRQAKTLLWKIRSTPIALAALPADFSIFSVPPLC